MYLIYSQTKLGTIKLIEKLKIWYSIQCVLCHMLQHTIAKVNYCMKTVPSKFHNFKICHFNELRFLFIHIQDGQTLV